MLVVALLLNFSDQFLYQIKPGNNIKLLNLGERDFAKSFYPDYELLLEILNFLELFFLCLEFLALREFVDESEME